ncbi:MAG: domain containing protein [Conexibacter sp.]|nr:domain containing protein [Conexibacter sp.]
MFVAELWVYPVKSLRGQPLERTRLDADGVPGDRRVQVRDGRDELVTARTRHGLLGLQATLDDAGEALVEGVPWREPAARDHVRAVAGEQAALAPMEGRERFDDTSILVATDGAVAALGVDRRRLRPNLLIAGVEGLAERDWPGGRLRIGGAVLDVEKLCERCVMTTIDPDTLAVDADVLRRINRDYDKRYALNCWVAEPGPVALGDPVELL